MSAELTAETVQDARRHEKAPSGGWRTIGAKEFANRKLIVTMPTDAPITDALG